jgi:hypothetical protein
MSCPSARSSLCPHPRRSCRTGRSVGSHRARCAIRVVSSLPQLVRARQGITVREGLGTTPGDVKGRRESRSHGSPRVPTPQEAWRDSDSWTHHTCSATWCLSPTTSLHRRQLWQSHASRMRMVGAILPRAWAGRRMDVRSWGGRRRGELEPRADARRVLGGTGAFATAGGAWGGLRSARTPTDCIIIRGAVEFK